MKIKLGDILISANAITEEQLKIALQEQKAHGGKIGEVLINLGFATELSIAKAIHKQLDIPIVNLMNIDISEKIVNMVDDAILRKYNVMPFKFSESNGNVLKVAMVDPMNFNAIDDLSIITNYQIEPTVTTLEDITYALDRYYANKGAMKAEQRYTEEKKELLQQREEEKTNTDITNAPIVVIVNTIIEQAVRQRASDIHIEALEQKIRIRYRIDGVLKESMSFNINMLAALITRVKIISNLDISEKRKPQDGRISKVIDRQEFDIRVSVLPTIYGEKVVMRLTPKQASTKDKSDLGFSDEEVKQFDKMLRHSNGIILVTGPTGSGKSTTLCCALNELNREEVNIITVEDPVEANIDGVNQVQVNTKADLTFASALRSILRQDPDIIMIGEIRDGETAQIAVKASITGHLVVSTLHTNDAVSSISRLADMGVERYMIADSVIGIIAQRLVRRLCTECRIQYTASEAEKKMLGYDTNKELKLYKPCGCKHCSNTGYKGRIGIYELMNVSQRMKELIASGETTEVLEKCALEEGMNTLKISGGKKVIQGITSLEELLRVVYKE